MGARSEPTRPRRLRALRPLSGPARWRSALRIVDTRGADASDGLVPRTLDSEWGAARVPSVPGRLAPRNSHRACPELADWGCSCRPLDAWRVALLCRQPS